MYSYRCTLIDVLLSIPYLAALGASTVTVRGIMPGYPYQLASIGYSA